MKQAILVASFGTTHPDTLQLSIAGLEQSLADRFPGAKIVRAFTSGVVRSRLERLHGIRVPSVEEALEELCREQFDEVILQPSLLIPGEEFDRLCRSAQPFAGRVQLRIGRPLLCEEADLDRMTGLLREAFAPGADTVLLMMGHGTAHAANDLYVRLAEKMKEVRECTMRLCTVEGTPTFADAVEELRQLPQRSVIAAPMMLVAGDHAKNDMAGDGPDSLRSLLEAEGLRVDCRLQGLGQLEQIRQLYADRIREIL